MSIEIQTGDCRQLLRDLPDESVQCCVTSPPYWGLRSYLPEGHPDKALEIGSERTPEEYLATIVAVFVEVRRVLRPDGTLWLNMGDCYVGGRGGATGKSGLEGSTAGQDESKRAKGLRVEGEKELRVERSNELRDGNQKRSGAQPSTLNPQPNQSLNPQPSTLNHSGPRLGHRSSFRRDRAPRQDAPHKTAFGLPAKNLVGMPWRVAFALQADGWILRSDIIWHKPNPMPESVTDRPTKSHEYIFLMSKSERYYYDAEAIKEPQSQGTHERFGKNPAPSTKRKLAENGSQIRNNRSFNDAMVSMILSAGRNKRSVWSVNSFAYSEAHFATFPPDLIKPCILVGCPVGGLVLDPFGGSGTTGMVAMELGRRALLMELSAEYSAMGEQRCAVTPGLNL